VRLQRTIKHDLSFEGTGLHTGHHAVMTLKPAPRDTGIVFFRKDKGAYINASVNMVQDTAFATTLGQNGSSIRTVEHIMAAVAGLGVDNLLIEVTGPEVPIMDGSALGFAERIMQAGLARQASNRPYIVVTRPVLFVDGRTEILVEPYDGQLITYQTQFEHPLLGHQKLTVELGRESFFRELAPARTFGFLRDIEYLKSQGLALCGSLDNAIVVSDDGILNPTGLRFKDEFIRHKILDFIGDIALGGFPIHGHFHVTRSGHTTNPKFIRHFLSSPECWQMVTDVPDALKASA